MQKNLQEEYSSERPLYLPGLSLGWRLTIYLSLIVGIVMGGVTFIQRSIELKNQRLAHENLIRESLAPLAVRLESTDSLDELRTDIKQFHLAYANRGHPSHEVILLDEKDEIVFSTFPNINLENKQGYLTASMPVLLPVLENRVGNLVVFKDITEYRQSVRRQWLFWTLHLAITLITIFLFLYPAVYFLVTRPIKNLVKGVKKMEMGYWGKVPLKAGAWEVRWLAWRFENMVSEVRKAVAHLLEAERKAQNLIYAGVSTNKSNSSKSVLNHVDTGAEDFTSPVYQELLMKCQQLESISTVNQDSILLAQKVWQEDAVKADRLGYWGIKSRLENAALRQIDPEAYHTLNIRLSEMQNSLKSWAEKCGRDLRDALEKKMIPYINISHRVKHTAGVWKKMKSKDLNLDEIHDLYAFRIIVPTESDCYTALGILHQAFKPVIGRFKDYIAHPKQNGYQSLHTCVMPKEGPIFEIQIRSAAMHQHSEKGTASHWLYKQNNGNGLIKVDKLPWWSKILRING
jgi:HAMP domain-containing protein